MKKLFSLLAILSAISCTKQPVANSITGVWVRDSGVEYSFFDDSRFRQSDLSGKQWIWEQRGEVVNLYGTPQRVWKILFLREDEVQVIEVDTFKLYRK